MSDSERLNLAMLDKIRAQEVRVGIARDELVSRDMILGPFGGAYEKTRSEARSAKQNKNLSATLTLGLALSSTMSPFRAAGSTMTRQSLETIARSNSGLVDEIDGMSSAYYAAIAPSVKAAGAMTLDMFDVSLSAAVGDQARLRAELKALYQRRNN